MSIPKERRGFFQRLSKNLDHVDKQTLLTQLVSESESHQNWLNVFDRLAEGVLIVSPDGQIDFINASAKKMLKVSVSAEKHFWTQLADKDLRDFFAAQLPQLSSEVLQTFRMLHPKERNVKLHLHPEIFNQPKKHLITLIDLTDSLFPEVERLTRNRFESIIRLAGGLAHEIGNPLNAISLHSEILKKQIHKMKFADSEKLDETIQVIQDEIHRLDRIVRSFLKTTRRPPLRFRMMNLSALVSDVARVLKPSLEEHAIQLTLTIPEKIEFYLDEERIRSMLMNLIQNAIESMMDGGQLTISMEILHEQVVKIQIQDTGRGISSEDIPHIFEAYFTTKDHGSGLGLLFVYDAVTDHGGKIQVESKPGKGTRFEILLPLRRSNLQINHSDASQRKGEDDV